MLVDVYSYIVYVVLVFLQLFYEDPRRPIIVVAALIVGFFFGALATRYASVPMALSSGVLLSLLTGMLVGFAIGHDIFALCGTRGGCDFAGAWVGIAVAFALLVGLCMCIFTVDIIRHQRRT